MKKTNDRTYIPGISAYVDGKFVTWRFWVGIGLFSILVILGILLV